MLKGNQIFYFKANHGAQLQIKNMVKSQIKLCLPFTVLDLVYKFEIICLNICFGKTYVIESEWVTVV